MASTDVDVKQISRKIVSAYYKAQASSRRYPSSPNVFNNVIERDLKELITGNGFPKFAEALMDVAESMVLSKSIMLTVNKAVGKVMKDMKNNASSPHEDHVHVSVGDKPDKNKSWCGRNLTITTFDGEFMGALRSAIVCQCPDGIFCNFIYRKIEGGDLASLFRTMRSKLESFTVAGSSKKMYWAIPMFSKLILNIGFDFVERASWDGETDELFVTLDYGTRVYPNMQEVIAVSGVNGRTYQKLVGEKQMFYANGIIGPDQDMLFPQPCSSRDHRSFGDNKRVTDWAGQDTYNHLCAKFCMHYFGVCYLCIYRRDPEMMKSRIIDPSVFTNSLTEPF